MAEEKDNRTFELTINVGGTGVDLKNGKISSAYGLGGKEFTIDSNYNLLDVIAKMEEIKAYLITKVCKYKYEK